VPATKTAPTEITAIPSMRRGVNFSRKKIKAATAIMGRSMASIGKILLSGKWGSNASQKKKPIAPPTSPAQIHPARCQPTTSGCPMARLKQICPAIALLFEISSNKKKNNVITSPQVAPKAAR
jgi:hypothetical protein